MNPPEAPPIILASASPRRKELLEDAGYSFSVVPASVEEIEDPSQSGLELTQANARLKAESVANLHPGSVVLGADTLVALDGKTLGKPASEEEAFEMVRTLSGRTHQVHTAVCLIRHRDGQRVEYVETTRVTFKALSDKEIQDYHLLMNPLDKAGAYAAQEHGDLILSSWTGSWTNVVGLPMEKLPEALSRFA